MGLLAWITLLPLFGAGLCMLVPREEEAIHRGIGLLTAIVTFAVSLLILPDFDSAQAGFQLRARACPVAAAARPNRMIVIPTNGIGSVPRISLNARPPDRRCGSRD